jgi:hypothetical protein
MGFVPIHRQAVLKGGRAAFDVDFSTLRTRAGEAPIKVKSLRTRPQDTSRNSIAGMQGKARGAQDTAMHRSA